MCNLHFILYNILFYVLTKVTTICMMEVNFCNACYSSESESTSIGHDPSSTLASGSYIGEVGSMHPITRFRSQRSPCIDVFTHRLENSIRQFEFWLVITSNEKKSNAHPFFWQITNHSTFRYDCSCVWKYCFFTCSFFT